MRIEELIKEASVTPYSSWHEKVMNCDNVIVAECWGFAVEAKTTARLIAHCLNNFMPMVEALEGCLAVLKFKNIHGHTRLDAEQALESAKEVHDGH